MNSGEGGPGRERRPGPGAAPGGWGHSWSRRHGAAGAGGGWPHGMGRGTGSERFGIFRDVALDKTAQARARERGRATRWAVLGVLAAMVTLFICLVLIDFTRTERIPNKKAVNATARSFGVEQTEARHRSTAELPGGFAQDRRYPPRYSVEQPGLSFHPHFRGFGRALQDHFDAEPLTAPTAPTFVSATQSEVHPASLYRRSSDISADEDFTTADFTNRDDDVKNEQREEEIEIVTENSPLNHEESTLREAVGVSDPLGQGHNGTVSNETLSDVKSRSSSTLEEPIVVLPVETPISNQSEISADNAPEDAEATVALPYRSPLGFAAPPRWQEFQPPREPAAMSQEEHEKWLDILRMHYKLEKKLAARKQLEEAQRRNFFTEMGTFHGEQIMVPNNYGQTEASAMPPTYATPVRPEGQKTEGGPRKVVNMMLRGKSRPFRPNGAGQASQNQYLVVNNKGVVIPHSVNFPELVKQGNYAQLQSYNNQQGSKNIQDLIKYLINKGGGLVAGALGTKRNNAWNAPLKKSAKVSGIYVSPNMDYENHYNYPRHEPYVNDHMFVSSDKVTESLDKHEVPYNGHAYIADPFHPYKPSDPAEINHMLSAPFDTQTSSSDHIRYDTNGHRDDMFASNHDHSFPLFPRPGMGFAGLRRPHLQQQAPQYTTATFKPLGGEIASAETTSSSLPALPGTMGTGKPNGQKRVPPLSVMLEIYPMGEKHKEPPIQPWATLRPMTMRKPTGIQSILQMDQSIKRPVALPLDGSPKYPTQMQGHLHTGNGQPTFGVTLTGLQGLQATGMPLPDSKHRMIVHLNFYPKKAVTMPMRLRDQSESIGQGSSLLTGGTFPQRRQSGDGRFSDDEGEDGMARGASVAVDVAPILRALPPDIRQHLTDILLSYQNPTTQTDREDYDDDDDESYEDEDDDTDSSTYPHLPLRTHRDEPRNLGDDDAVDAEPSSEDTHDEYPSEYPPWLFNRGAGQSLQKSTKLSKKPRKIKHKSNIDDNKSSYFDVQESDEDYEGEENSEGEESNENEKGKRRVDLEDTAKRSEEHRKLLEQTNMLLKQQEKHRKYLQDRQQEVEDEEKRQMEERKVLKKRRFKAKQLHQHQQQPLQQQQQHQQQQQQLVSDDMLDGRHDKDEGRVLPKNHRSV